MKTILSVLLLLIAHLCFAQDVKLYSEPFDKGYIMYADNNEYCPVSVKIDFELNNMRSLKGNGKIFVIPARTKKHKITELVKGKKGAYSFKSKSWRNFGDHYQKTFDNTYTYNLPYSKGSEFKVHQGYNGTFSHQEKNQLDFTMPIGTKICAAREGIVVKVIDSNSKNCQTEDCIKYNNYIVIFQPDGTFAKYVHIKQNSSKVKIGDSIKKGQVIAESGNVGFSTGPHLHFEVYLQKLKSSKSLKTKFKINDGSTSLLLKQGRTYRREY